MMWSSPSVTRSRLREKLLQVYPQGIGQDHQLKIDNALDLSLNSRECTAADIPPMSRTTSGQHLLADPQAVLQLPNLRSHCIFLCRHAPKVEVDNNHKELDKCSEI
jgi:hypothetical protein